MKKRSLLVAIVLIFSFILSGCVSAVELTDKESSLIADYSSYVMIKHSRFKSSYLYGRSELEALKEADNKKPEKEPDLPVEEETETPSQPEEPLVPADNPTTDKHVDVKKDYLKHSVALGLSDVTIGYKGYEVKEAYVLDYFALNAAKGNNLIILKFDLLNNSDKDIDIDMSKISPEYTITVNNAKTIKAMSTILLNDLASYKASLSAGESKSVVLIFEAPASVLSSVESIDLAVKVNGNSNYIEL